MTEGGLTEPLGTFVHTIGHGLRRPESVLAHESGNLFVSHGGCGVMRIHPDGAQTLLSGPTELDGVPIQPNGIAMRPDGSFLVANIADTGGLLELDADGVRLFHSCAIGGDAAPPVNYVCLDPLGRVWITVSSSFSPRSRAYRRDVANGYVGILEPAGLRIVLQGLHYTNEIAQDWQNGWLYIAETFGQKITRVRLDETGPVGEPALFCQMPRGAFVDGIELTAEGGLVAACIVSNELFHIDPDGHRDLILGERVGRWVDEVEAALDAGEMGRPHFDTAPTRHLRNIASTTFTGPDRTRIVCGNLLAECLPVIDTEIVGAQPLHWSADLPDWGTPFRA